MVASRPDENALPRLTRDLVTIFALAWAVASAPLALASVRLYAAGEAAPDWAYVAAHPELTYGRLLDDYYDFKVFMASARRPRVLVLGSSRVMEVTSGIFTKCGDDPRCFYNAGGAMPTIRAALDALRRLPDGYFPEVLILAIDYWHIETFPANLHSPTTFDADTDALDRFKHEILAVRTWITGSVADPLLRRVLLTPWNDGPGVGLRARQQGSGFRGDGSFDYGRTERPALDDPRKYDEIEGQADTGTGWFYGGTAIDQKSIEELRAILALARGHGAEVIGYMPPFMDEVASAARAGGRQPIWARVPAAAREAFDVFGYPFFDTLTNAQAGCPSVESLDGYHPTEPCNARIFARLARDARAGPVLRPFIDPDALDRLTAQPASPMRLTAP